MAERVETPGLRKRVNKAFRVRGDAVRQIYSTARKAERFLRDAPRRAALRRLPDAAWSIPPDAGFLVLPPGRLEETAAVVAEARAALARYDERQPLEGKNRKRFLVNVLDAATLSLDSPTLRLALREDVLAAVSRYLGTVPFLSTVSVFYSDAVETELSSSQLHHCDGDDITQVKIFVYASDVDARCGPLTVVTAADSARVRRETKYQYRQRLTDEQVRAVVGAEGEHPIVGPAGTTAFVDTSRCFHYGSRVAPDAPPRLATMIQYQTPYSFMVPTSAQASLPFRRLSGRSLTALQRLVLGE
jgi:hypothetical protein